MLNSVLEYSLLMSCRIYNTPWTVLIILNSMHCVNYIIQHALCFNFSCKHVPELHGGSRSMRRDNGPMSKPRACVWLIKYCKLLWIFKLFLFHFFYLHTQIGFNQRVSVKDKYHTNQCIVRTNCISVQYSFLCMQNLRLCSM